MGSRRWRAASASAMRCDAQRRTTTVKQSPESRIVFGGTPHEHHGMKEPTKISNQARGLSDYWTVLCAVLLVVTVVYAVFKST